MESLTDNPLPGEVNAAAIDEAMLEMSEFVAQMTDVNGYLYDQEMSVAMQVEKIHMSIPIQLDLQVKDDGSVTLGGSPPLYYADTTILPVFHQLNIKIKVYQTEEGHGGSNE